MTPEEGDLIRRYIAGELSIAAVDVAELLVLIDEDAAATVDESLVQRDRASVPPTDRQANYKSR